MKHFTPMAAWIFILLFGLSHGGFADERPPMDAGKLAQTQNAFATDLYAQLRRQPGNLFLSPHSIATALTMTFVGARGDTASEMARVLHLQGAHAGEADALTGLKAQVCEAYDLQRRLLNAHKDGGFSLHVANALWAAAGYPLKAEFLTRIRDSFGGHVESLDFSNEPAARERINQWVSDQTRGKIKKLIGRGALNRQTPLVLTNAIYFKAAWEEQFRPEATRKEKFHVSAGRDVDAMMLNRTGFYDLAELKGVRLLILPYKDQTASMILLLPDKMDGLAALEDSLTAENLSSWRHEAKPTQVALSLPKFETTSSFELNTPLIALGMRKAFRPGEANLTGIARVAGAPLYVGLVIHKAFVEVDEEGTEAAAATAVALGAAAPMPSRPVRFAADHPFVYIILDNRTHEILFMGRMCNPAEPGA
jgi:serpin B